MAKYQNRDGVVVDAELVEDGEHAGLWHITDKDGVEGHASDEAFQRNFSLVEEPAQETPPVPPARGKK